MDMAQQSPHFALPLYYPKTLEAHNGRTHSVHRSDRGLAGDMLCASLLDAGLNETVWREALDQFNGMRMPTLSVPK